MSNPQSARREKALALLAQLEPQAVDKGRSEIIAAPQASVEFGVVLRCKSLR